jgi:tetratricopeptide (TPR) repeat protein
VKLRFRIFVSSPGDVKQARELAALTVEKLAQDYARYLLIEPYLWEFEAMLASGHFQDSIEPPSAFDVVVLIVWSRLGTPMPERTSVREYRGMDGRVPVTGTEWEFEEALQAAKNRGAPDLLVYRNNSPAPFDTRDPDLFDRQSQQLKALNAFWQRHFGNQGMFTAAYTSFQTDEEFAATLEAHLRKLIERRIETMRADRGPGATKAWTLPPFRGLESYEFEHAPIFFGQDEWLAKGMLQLTGNAERGTPFLLVLGASGSGKSSLVKAGIAPKLFLPRRIAGAAFLRRVVFRPSDAGEGEDLFDALARRLTVQTSAQEGLPELLAHGQSVASLAAHLRTAATTPAYPIGMALGQAAMQAQHSGRMLDYESAKLLLVVDQLEELFTIDRIPTAQRVHFMELLAGLVRSGTVWVVAAMRKDFWHRADETPELVRLSEGGGRLDLLPPGAAQLSQMIRRPTEAADVAFEIHATTNVPLNDVIAEEVGREPGALPLLSYVLDQLYRVDVIEGQGQTLTYASYEKLGRLHGAIAKKADTVLQACAPEDRPALGSLLFALVSKGSEEGGIERNVARRVPLSTFPAGTPARRLVEAFLDPNARLLVTDANQGTAASVRIAHEALISSWPIAKEYVQNNTEALRIRRRLEDRFAHWSAIKAQRQSPSADSAHEHQRRGWRGALRNLLHPEAGLLADVDLADGRRLLRDHRIETEPGLIAYIERSAAHERRRRLRTVSALAAVATIMTVLAEVAYVRGNAALVETAIANRTTDFIEDMFKDADPEQSHGDQITAKQMLDVGASTIHSELAGEPRVRAQLQTVIGQAYSSLGLYPPAEAMLNEALTDERQTKTPDALRVLTLLAAGTALYSDNQDAAAGPDLQQAAALARQRLATSDPLRSAALTGLADLLADQGNYADAEKYCREALAADRERAPTPENQAILANTLNSLATSFNDRGDFTDAITSMREALTLRETALGMDSPLTGQSLNNLGAVLYNSGQYQDSVKEYEQALPIYKKVYGAEHPEIATLLNNIGRSDLMADDLTDAESLMQQSLAMTEKFYGTQHEDLIVVLNSLAMIDVEIGRQQAARQELQRAESIAQSTGQTQFLDQVELNEARVALASGDLTQTADLLSRSKDLLQKLHPQSPSEAWRYAVWDVVNAQLLATKGDVATATATLNAAQKVIDSRFGPASYYGKMVEEQLTRIEKPAAGAKRT